jgi:L-lactate dehydrogenase complex protein LldG
MVSWSAQALGWDLAGDLQADGFEAVAMPHDPVGEQEERRIRSLTAGAGIGLTGADLVIAETGTLVLISGPGKPRSTSLLPDCHIAVFGKPQLVERLEHAGIFLEWLHTDAGQQMGGAMINFITGPSRTADIELTLTRGVHGPREVHAVFVDAFGEMS